MKKEKAFNSNIKLKWPFSHGLSNNRYMFFVKTTNMQKVIGRIKNVLSHIVLKLMNTLMPYSMRRINFIQLPLKGVLISVFTILSYLNSYAQSPVFVNQPLNQPNTTGQYYNNVSIVLSPGFSANSNLGTFQAFISTTLPVPNPGPSTDQNFISTWQSKSPISTISALKNLESSTNDINIGVKYFDGTGRAMQTVEVKATASGADLVQPYEYDNSGRQVKNYLPYASYAGIAGSYRVNANTFEQGAYYQNATALIPQSATPFAKMSIENSPLERVLEKGSPGDYWQLTGTSGVSGHTFKFQYTDNNQVAISDVVNSRIAVQFTPGSLIPVTGNYYPNSDLFVTVKQDENWTVADGRLGTKEIYKDKEGRVILSRSFVKSASNAVNILSTYFIYDDFGNLVYVLPPGANPDAVAPGGYSITTDILNGYCYQYQYDEKQRVVAKKIPGKDWEYTVYNSLNQIVATQDGNQRLKSEWIIKKYDGLGRLIISGVWNSATNRPDLQITVNQQSTLWENKTTTGIGYTSAAWPQTVNIYYSINYYDDYNIPGMPAANAYQTYAGNPNGKSNQTQGHLTATKTSPLSNSAVSLWAVNYYDGNDRLIQMQNNNHLSGSDTYNSEYNFSGNVTKKVHQQVLPTQSVNITNRYIYDNYNRLLQNYEQIGADPEILLSQNEYNNLGQLMDKKLHQKNASSRFLQSMDYRYNIRGWLTSINDATLAINTNLNSDDPGTSDADKFGMQLSYEQALLPQFNGNLGSQQFKAAVPSSGIPAPPLLTYDFRYDKLNRLTEAVSSTGTIKDKNFAEYVNYDLMGNIQTLGRWSKLNAGRTQIDSLTYTYSGNQVNQIDDLSNNNIYGFSESFNGTISKQVNEYGFDANGNISKDLNKGIITVTYNDFNLPATLSWSNGMSVSYDYDGLGNKLKKVFNNGTQTITTDYVSGAQYNQGLISFVFTNEGIARKNPTGSSSDYTYQYNLTDQTGNTRVVIQPDLAGTSAVMMQITGYYPYGLEEQSDDATATYSYVSGVKDDYLFNGKEKQEETGTYDFGARQYDPATGRWSGPDPASQFLSESPYAALGNNPLIHVDKDGRFLNIIIGAVLGGVINVAIHWNKISSFKDGLAAFGIGAVAGGLAGATGGASLAATGLAGSTLAGGALFGLTAGATSSVVQGVGNAIYFHDKYSPGNLVQAAAIGGITGGIFGQIAGDLSESSGISAGNAQITQFGDDPVNVVTTEGEKLSAEGAVWAQKTYNANFSDDGLFSGRPIDEIAQELKDGTLTTQDVPINAVSRNGQTFLLDTRSTVALTRAGIPRSAWNVINQTGIQEFENRLTGQLLRNGVEIGFDSIRQAGTNIVITNH
jgi:RHS repeat-associated protein